ncbi:hypothetical protein EVAR_39738_1 [Eumeta japonica]|uniref:Uncharacterized protein n=1 Tax=Eumeta variegata TaxID=151549 RepID=A0A4C1X4U9_EUMVA|nr:hypothetical protein EVAR_39738_1 [Eumeta japonica]
MFELALSWLFLRRTSITSGKQMAVHQSVFTKRQFSKATVVKYLVFGKKKQSSAERELYEFRSGICFEALATRSVCESSADLRRSTSAARAAGAAGAARRPLEYCVALVNDYLKRALRLGTKVILFLDERETVKLKRTNDKLYLCREIDKEPFDVRIPVSVKQNDLMAGIFETSLGDERRRRGRRMCIGRVTRVKKKYAQASC